MLKGIMAMCVICGVYLIESNTTLREYVLTEENTGTCAPICDDCAKIVQESVEDEVDQS